MVLAIKGEYFLSHIWHASYITNSLHIGEFFFPIITLNDHVGAQTSTTTITLQKRRTSWTICLFVFFCFFTSRRSETTCIDYLNQELDAVDQSLLELEQILKDSDKGCMDLNTTKNAMDIYKVSSLPQQQVFLWGRVVSQLQLESTNNISTLIHEMKTIKQTFAKKRFSLFIVVSIEILKTTIVCLIMLSLDGDSDASWEN